METLCTICGNPFSAPEPALRYSKIHRTDYLEEEKICPDCKQDGLDLDEKEADRQKFEEI